MAECNPQEIMNEAACFNCTTERERALLKTALLCRLNAGSCDVAALAAEASTSGFFSLTKKQRQMAFVQLLCNISGGT